MNIMLNISDLPEFVKDNYNKWVSITGVNSLNEYFENALAECYPKDKYISWEIDDGYIIINSNEYTLFFSDKKYFKFPFGIYETLIEETYNNLNK